VLKEKEKQQGIRSQRDNIQKVRSLLEKNGVSRRSEVAAFILLLNFLIL
jgi:hypothetical protein